MFDCKALGRIKNDKIQRWRVELSPFNYSIQYRPGHENVVPDCLSRAFCAANVTRPLMELHASLCHPGVTRMSHFVRARNLPYSIDEIRRTIACCAICAKMKPRFFKPETSPLIKSTKPWERISLDFKGPLPSNTKNIFLLDIIDEYSRFPFSFACKDVSACTVIQCLTQLFQLFGFPAYVHSDRGTGFMSKT